jgi:hypothetical protein
VVADCKFVKKVGLGRKLRVLSKVRDCWKKVAGFIKSQGLLEESCGFYQKSGIVGRKLRVLSKVRDCWKKDSFF